MMRLLGVVFLVGQVLGKESPAELANKLEYTLVQFIQDTTCTGKRYVCQPVTLGQTVIFYTHERHGNDKVCATLKENTTDNTFAVDSCLASGPACPKECGCYEAQPKLVLDQCYGDTMKGHGKMATMLVKGEMPDCIKSAPNHRMDIDMAGYCNQWPSQPDGHYTKMAEDRGVAESQKLLQAKQHRSRSQLRMRRQSPSAETSMSTTGEELPEQGFSGKDVDHKNMETHTGDWGKEYGPGMSGAPKPKPKAKSGGVTRAGAPQVLASLTFGLLGLILASA